MNRRFHSIFSHKLLLAIVLVSLLVSWVPISVATAQTGTSYITVHAHNPEGIEIASIYRVGNYSVQIYDDDTLIGYGAHDAASHNQPIAINAGSHVIKVTFNGIALERNINLSPSETQTLIFAFERTSANILSYFDFNESNSFTQETEITSYYGPDWYSADSMSPISITNLTYAGGTDAILRQEAYATLTITPTSYTFDASTSSEIITECTGCAGLRLLMFWASAPAIKTISIPSQSFESWWIQNYMTAPSDVWCRLSTDACTDAWWFPLIHEYELGYVTAAVPATYEYTQISFITPSGIFIEESSEGGEFLTVSGSQTYSIDSNELKMSSIPYDITGTGVGDEENQPPVASFTLFEDREGIKYQIENPMFGQRLFVDASNSKDPDGEIAFWDWDLGDGTTKIWTDADRPEDYRLEYVYEKPGVYNIALTVIDNNGKWDEISMELDLTLKNGDLLLMRSERSAVCGLWTHIGIYDETREKVIEARLWSGVNAYSLEDWIYPTSTYVQVRRVNTDQATIDRAVDFAYDKRGQWYDWLSILQNTKQWALGDSWYCSELVWAAYLFASFGSIDLDPDMGLVSPDEISLKTELRGEHMEYKPGNLCDDSWFWGLIECPVDMHIIDPDGLVLNKLVNEVPDAIYEEVDIDNDGDLADAFIISQPKLGDYQISIVAEPHAMPSDTYSLKVGAYGQIIVLAENVLISNIPNEGYMVRSTETGVEQIIPAIIDFDSDVIYLHKKTKKVATYIELPTGYDVGEIDISTVKLNNTVFAKPKPAKVGDHDKDGIPDLMVKFDGVAVQGILDVGDNVEIMITGVVNGTYFKGSDYIRVIN